MRLLRLALSLVAALCLSPFASVSAAPAAVASADAIVVLEDDDDDDDGGAVTALAAQPAAPAVTLPNTGVGPASSATGADPGAVLAVAGVVLAAGLLMRRRCAVGSI